MAKRLGDMGDLFSNESAPYTSSSDLPAHHEVLVPILVTPPENGDITVQAAPGQVYFIDAMAQDLAQFDRDGGSLVVHQPYGGAVVLQDFLALTASTCPPALTLSDGVLIQADEIVSRMCGGIQGKQGFSSGANGRVNNGLNGYDGNDLFSAGDFDFYDEDDFDFPRNKESAPDSSSGENPLHSRLSADSGPDLDQGPVQGPVQGLSHVPTKIVLGLDDDDDGEVIDRPLPFDY